MFRQTLLIAALIRVCESQEPVCVATLDNGSVVGFQNGESFGDVLNSPCGAIADYPCFCDSTENDKIRCPYCPFLTGERNIVCARSGESITFIDEFNIEQTCTCEYLGNNQVQTVCDPQSVPTQQCALERNTDRCPELTEFINFDVDCPCVSFCLGEFVGCCNYGESCSVTCPGGATEDDIVSGCKIDPFKASVTPPPVAPVAPTVAPAMAPRDCVLQANRENCPAVTLNQAPVEGCGANACYNYCDDQFQGCCELDDMECDIQCSGATEPVITAGCRLDDTVCGFFGQLCMESSDCCSSRCVAGKCARPGLLGSIRAKLSGERGGSAAVFATGDGLRRLNRVNDKIRGSVSNKQER